MPRFDDIPANVHDITAAHRALYLADPEKAHLWDGTAVGVSQVVTTLLLATLGRRSGKERHSPLLYMDHGGGYLVVGSKGGYPDHPSWYLNLQARPRCEIRVAALRTPAVARTLEGDERADAWAKLVARHPVYAKYQARAERRIPLVLLGPVATPDA